MHTQVVGENGTGGKEIHYSNLLKMPSLAPIPTRLSSE